MAFKKRTKVPADIRRLTFLEAGHKCPVPHCGSQIGLECHHIDGNPTNHIFENVVVLCANHHAKATSGDIDRQACRLIKVMLANGEAGFLSRMHLIPTRAAIQKELCARINETTTLRATICGPLFLHPEWYYDGKASKSVYDFDLHEKRFVERLFAGASVEAKFIITSFSRYFEKVNAVVRRNDQERFKSYVLAEIERLWYSGGEPSGPAVCCVYPGLREVSYIFDDAMISQHRVTETTPTGGGLLTADADLVSDARHTFDQRFNQFWRGHEAEVTQLKELIHRLWK